MRAARAIAAAAFLAGAVAAAPAHAAERTLTLDPAACTLTFLLDTTFHEVHGTMKITGGSIRFDTGGGAASGTITADAKSAATGNGRRDRTMHAEILESERFPEVVFTVARVEGALPESGAGTLTLAGTMRLHGADHEVTLPATVRRDGDRVHAETSLTVPYVEWGLEDPSFLFVRAEKTVAVTITVEGRLGAP